MRHLIPMALACALAHEVAHAQNDQIQRGPAPDWVTVSEPLPVPEDATGFAFVRRQDVLIHLDEQGQQQYQGSLVKLLHPNALELGNFSVAWNPASGVPTVHVLKVHRDGVATDLLEKASFEILRREGQLEAAQLDGVLTAVHRIADLRVGDELEIGLTIRVNDPTLGKNDAGLLLLGPSPAAGRYRLGLSWNKSRNPSLKMTPDMTSAASKGERRIEFRFDNPAMLSPPKDAPARYQWQRVVEFSDFADWTAISRHFAPLFVKAAKLADDSPLKREASRIMAAHADPMGRASAALKLVQQNVRYIYIGLNGGNLTPATAEETWQRRYGDCKGKTALLLALLQEMGIEAEPVLANNGGNDDGLDARLPSPRMFDHVLVRARIDGKVYWLDGTMPPVVSPSVAPTLPYGWVLPLTARGSTIEALAWQPAKRPDEVTLYDIDARAGFDQPAKVKNTTIMRGVKGLEQQVQFSALAPGQLLNAMRQNAVGGLWTSIDDVSWRYDQKAQASVLTISGTWTVDWDDDGDGARSVALPGGGFSPPDRRARGDNQGQDVPFYNEPSYSCHVATVRFPTETKKANWSSKPSYDTHIFGKNYYRAIDISEDSIRMVRGFRVESREISAASARQDNGRIASFDNSMAWINYDPALNQKPRNGTAVPATYEIDWTADDVPCLSPSTAR